MNKLVNIDFNLTMSSLEIAELTGKRHAHVLRDIRGMFDELGIEPNFGLSEYKVEYYLITVFLKEKH